MSTTAVQCRLFWLPQEIGGRKSPPPGLVYTPTARFAEDALEKQFSIVLRLQPPTENNGDECQEAELSCLFPDIAQEMKPRMLPGKQLLVHEGKQVVVVCVVENVKENSMQPASGVSKS